MESELRANWQRSWMVMHQHQAICTPSAVLGCEGIENMNASGYTKEWLMNGRVLACRFQRTDRATADAWYADMRDMFLAWNEDRPLHLLIDLSQPGTMSAQGMMRARQLSHVRPDLVGRTAILVGRSLATQVMKALIRSGLGEGARQRLMFSSEQSAVAWLLENDTTSTAEIRRTDLDNP